MSKKVSVITLNWNGLKWLERCLDSLTQQTYKNIEVIMVDNDSHDDSVSFVKSKFPSVKIVINDSNLGFAGGNNSGIAAAQGDFILLINNDVWVEPTLVEGLMRTYDEGKCDVLAPFSTEYEQASRKPYASTIDLLGHPVYYRDLLPGKQYKNFYLSGVAMFFPKQLYIDTSGLDDNFFMYFEEADWFWRLRLLGKTFAYDPNNFVYHAGAGSTGGLGGLKYKSFLWRNQNNLQMLLKNYAWYNLLWVLPLYIAQNILEIITFLITGKPQIAKTYTLGWLYNLQTFSRIMAQRRWIQKHRTVSDREIMKHMYKGLGKLHHLMEYRGKG